MAYFPQLVADTVSCATASVQTVVDVATINGVVYPPGATVFGTGVAGNLAMYASGGPPFLEDTDMAIGAPVPSVVTLDPSGVGDKGLFWDSLNRIIGFIAFDNVGEECDIGLVNNSNAAKTIFFRNTSGGAINIDQDNTGVTGQGIRIRNQSDGTIQITQANAGRTADMNLSVLGGGNLNLVANTGDVTISTAGNLSILNNAVALSGNTTTIASGNAALTISTNHASADIAITTAVGADVSVTAGDRLSLTGTTDAAISIAGNSGGANDVLTALGTGLCVWAPPPAPTAFNCMRIGFSGGGASQNINDGSFATLGSGSTTTVYVAGGLESEWDVVNGEWTVGETGIYDIQLSIMLNAGAINRKLNVGVYCDIAGIVVPDAYYPLNVTTAPPGGNITTVLQDVLTWNAVLSLTATQVLKWVMSNDGGYTFTVGNFTLNIKRIQ